jgi:Obg family GTPase CgtA-like protein
VAALLDRLAVVVGAARTAEAAASPDPVVHRPAPEGVAVTRLAPGVWEISGRAAERAVNLSDLTDDGAMDESVRRLKRLGVDRSLSRAGAHDGDEVRIGPTSFTWYRDQGDQGLDAKGPDPVPGGGRARSGTPRRTARSRAKRTPR